MLLSVLSSKGIPSGERTLHYAIILVPKVSLGTTKDQYHHQ
jgi:hypothetical protein